MPNGAGDLMLDGFIKDAATNLEHPAEGQTVCPEHDKLRQGVYVLILCEKDRRAEQQRLREEHKAEERANKERRVTTASNFLSWSKKEGVKAAGVPAIILGAILAMLLFQYMHSQKIEAIAKKVAEDTITKVVKP